MSQITSEFSQVTHETLRVRISRDHFCVFYHEVGVKKDFYSTILGAFGLVPHKKLHLLGYYCQILVKLILCF